MLRKELCQVPVGLKHSGCGAALGPAFQHPYPSDKCRRKREEQYNLQQFNKDPAK
jgi:hypothetical protein